VGVALVAKVAPVNDDFFLVVVNSFTLGTLRGQLFVASKAQVSLFVGGQGRAGLDG